MAATPPIGTAFLTPAGRVTEPWLAYFGALASGFSASFPQTVGQVLTFPATLSPVNTGIAPVQIQVSGNQSALDLWDVSSGAVTPAGGSRWRIWADNQGGGGGLLTFGFVDVANARIAAGFDNAGWFNASVGLKVANSANVTMGSDWVQFTPSIQAISPGMGVSLSTIADCSYYRIGKLCFVKYNLAFNITGTGQWFNLFLPFNNAAPGATVAAGPVFLSGGGSTSSWVNGYCYCGSSVFTIAFEGYANFPVGVLYVQGEFFYQI